MHVYKAWNSAMATTAPQASVTTGTSTKTMLQLATPSTRKITIISWGYSIESGPATGPLIVDLIEADTAATVTAHLASGVQPQDPGNPASLLTLGTSATGYTSSSETAPTATRTLDALTIGPNASSATDLRYSWQWMPDERPIIAISKFVRLRATFATAINMRCWITWAE